MKNPNLWNEWESWGGRLGRGLWTKLAYLLIPHFLVMFATAFIPILIVELIKYWFFGIISAIIQTLIGALLWMLEHGLPYVGTIWETIQALLPKALEQVDESPEIFMMFEKLKTDLGNEDLDDEDYIDRRVQAHVGVIRTRTYKPVINSDIMGSRVGDSRLHGRRALVSLQNRSEVVAGKRNDASLMGEMNESSDFADQCLRGMERENDTENSIEGTCQEDVDQIQVDMEGIQSLVSTLAQTNAVLDSKMNDLRSSTVERANNEYERMRTDQNAAESLTLDQNSKKFEDHAKSIRTTINNLQALQGEAEQTDQTAMNQEMLLRIGEQATMHMKAHVESKAIRAMTTAKVMCRMAQRVEMSHVKVRESKTVKGESMKSRVSAKISAAVDVEEQNQTETSSKNEVITGSSMEGRKRREGQAIKQMRDREKKERLIRAIKNRKEVVERVKVQAKTANIEYRKQEKEGKEIWLKRIKAVKKDSMDSKSGLSSSTVAANTAASTDYFEKTIVDLATLLVKLVEKDSTAVNDVSILPVRNQSFTPNMTPLSNVGNPSFGLTHSTSNGGNAAIPPILERGLSTVSAISGVSGVTNNSNLITGIVNNGGGSINSLPPLLSDITIQHLREELYDFNEINKSEIIERYMEKQNLHSADGATASISHEDAKITITQWKENILQDLSIIVVSALVELFYGKAETFTNPNNVIPGRGIGPFTLPLVTSINDKNNDELLIENRNKRREKMGIEPQHLEGGPGALSKDNLTNLLSHNVYGLDEDSPMHIGDTGKTTKDNDSDSDDDDGPRCLGFLGPRKRTNSPALSFKTASPGENSPGSAAASERSDDKELPSTRPKGSSKEFDTPAESKRNSTFIIPSLVVKKSSDLNEGARTASNPAVYKIDSGTEDKSDIDHLHPPLKNTKKSDRESDSRVNKRRSSSVSSSRTRGRGMATARARNKRLEKSLDSDGISKESKDKDTKDPTFSKLHAALKQLKKSTKSPSTSNNSSKSSSVAPVAKPVVPKIQRLRRTTWEFEVVEGIIAS